MSPNTENPLNDTRMTKKIMIAIIVARSQFERSACAYFSHPDGRLEGFSCITKAYEFSQD